VRTVLFLFPTQWDARQLEACRPAWEGRFAARFAEPADEDCRWDLPILDHLESIARENRARVDGVVSSSDYPGAIAAAVVAERLGLPGSPPGAILRASHKYYARLAQRPAVPEATPWFALVDPDAPDATRLRFPCFLKPVKGAFSVLSGRIDGADELRAFLRRPAVGEFAREYLAIFNRLLGRFTDFEVDGSRFLAEELLSGAQATVEGFALDGEVEVFGIVDSVLHPGTGSFVRFDYPSGLPAAVQERMAAIARRAAAALGLRHSMFNVEMIHDPDRDSIHVIEVNPRIAGQFGDLYQKVDGANSYEFLLALAAGSRPRVPRRRGTFAAAASVPLRAFRPCRVRRAPSAADVRAAEGSAPGTLVWIECRERQDLAEFDRLEDGHSARYAVINVGGRDREDATRRASEVESRLGFDLAPLA
jgi:biotin carboxylase